MIASLRLEPRRRADRANRRPDPAMIRRGHLRVSRQALSAAGAVTLDEGQLSGTFRHIAAR